MSLVCPYCKSKMLKGFLKSGRYNFKWHDENAGFIEKNTIFGGEIISNMNLVSAYRCKGCNKIIIDLETVK